MSPQPSSLTSSLFLPRMVYSRPSFSFWPEAAFTRVMSEVRLPEMTLTKENLPYWSAMVLNTKAAGTAPWETMKSSCSPSLLVAEAGTPSRGLGSRSTIKSSSIRVPRPV